MSPKEIPTTKSPVPPSPPAIPTRIFPEDIRMAIASAKAVDYYRPPGTTMTICTVTLANGFNVVGTSACVSPENYDETTGEMLAMNKVKDQLWELLGYALKDTLHLHGFVEEQS